MESLSPAIGQKAILRYTTTHSDHDLFLSSVRLRTVRNPSRVSRRLRIRVQAKNGASENAAGGGGGIDFSDPNWKLKYQREFEARFNIPHITDVFPDAVEYPSTFCLKMRTPVSEEFAEGYPSDEKWHGYINNNDRVLLKVIDKVQEEAKSRTDRKPPGVGRGRGRGGRDDSAVGRQAKGIGRGMDDGGAKGRGKGGPSAKSGGRGGF